MPPSGAARATEKLPHKHATSDKRQATSDQRQAQRTFAMSYAGGLEVSMAARAAYESIGKTTHRAGVRGQKPNGNRTREMIWEASGLGACGRPEGSRRGPQRAGGGDSGHLTPGVDAWEPGRAPEQSAASVAWHREHMLPLGAVSSHTWRGHDDTGRTALLREVPDGQKPIVATSGPLGILPLREVTVITDKRVKARNRGGRPEASGARGRP